MFRSCSQMISTFFFFGGGDVWTNHPPLHHAKSILLTPLLTKDICKLMLFNCQQERYRKIILKAENKTQ